METRPFRGIRGMKAFLNIQRIITIRRFMLGAWLFYYLSWSIWSKEAFAEFILGLSRSLLWKTLFLIFLFVFTIEIVYKFHERLKSGLFRSILWLIMPAGLVIFLTGVFLSTSMRMETKILTGGGDIFKVPWGEKRYGVMDVRSGIKERFLDIEQESPSPIFTREPLLLLTDFKRTYRIGVYPPVRIDGMFFHILDFNIAPSIEIRDRKGDTVIEGDLALRILPAGNTDYAVLEGLPYRVTMKLLPSGEIKRGEVVAKEYNLGERLYELKVFRIINPDEAGTLIAEGVSRTPLKFDDYSLTVTGHTYWAVLEIVKDDAVYIIGTGLVFMIIGLFVRMLFLPFWLSQLKKPKM